MLHALSHKRGMAINVPLLEREQSPHVQRIMHRLIVAGPDRKSLLQTSPHITSSLDF